MNLCSSVAGMASSCNGSGGGVAVNGGEWRQRVGGGGVRWPARLTTGLLIAAAGLCSERACRLQLAARRAHKVSSGPASASAESQSQPPAKADGAKGDGDQGSIKQQALPSQLARWRPARGTRIRMGGNLPISDGRSPPTASRRTSEADGLWVIERENWSIRLRSVSFHPTVTVPPALAALNARHIEPS